MLCDFVERDVELKYKEEIAAVVVTYNPDLKRFERVVHSLKKEVKYIVIVDNGSKNIANIEEIAGRKIIIRMNINKGIAEGLNAGIKKALSQHKSIGWILTLDQDTIIKKGAIASIFEEFETLQNSIKDRTGILAMSPKEKDEDMYTYPVPSNSNFVRKLFAQTSGNLVRARIFASIRFRDDFFIDQVDHEFDMRVRSNEFLIMEYDKKMLDHSLGKKENVGKKKIDYYNERRLYYYTRNSTYLITHYEGFPLGMYVLGILSMYSRFLRVNGAKGLFVCLYVFLNSLKDGILGKLGENRHISEMKLIR